MGWIQNRRSISAAAPSDSKATASHVENAILPQPVSTSVPLHATSDTFPAPELPYICPEVVASQKGPKELVANGRKLWIVINDIVYDCTTFAAEHPGGETVIQSFQGEDCSWQFWRFHSKKIMQDWGGQLQVGRTKGVPNRFTEPTRWRGLKVLGTKDEGI